MVGKVAPKIHIERDYANCRKANSANGPPLTPIIRQERV